MKYRLLSFSEENKLSWMPCREAERGGAHMKVVEDTGEDREGRDFVKEGVSSAVSMAANAN